MEDKPKLIAVKNIENGRDKDLSLEEAIENVVEQIEEEYMGNDSRGR